MKATRVAVLGSGIMGCSVALLLARRGVRVTLVDMAEEPFSGASRWNEGKIHLGYLYSGDRSRETARRLVPGGLAFKRLTEELIGCSLDGQITRDDDVYLVHRDSVVSAEAMRLYFEQTAELVRDHPDSDRYLVDVSDGVVRSLSDGELDELTDTQTIHAGYRVPERSVRTEWVADRYIEAVRAEPRIALALSTRVRGAHAAKTSNDRAWTVDADPPLETSFDVVVNSLWQGRPGIDRTAGLKPGMGWSHRYRLSVFARTARDIDAPSVVIATGPFGDIKNYNGRDFYCSWYPAGLVAEGHSTEPPELPPLDDPARREIADSTMRQLSGLLAPAGTIAAEALTTKVEGGWVFAQGQGSLSDPLSTLHRRDRFGIRAPGPYVSIDTGKYSMAPWLAHKVVDRIAGGAR